MDFLTKEAIKNREVPLNIRKVDIPEWDGFVYVKELTARDRDEYESSLIQVNVDDSEADEGSFRPSKKVNNNVRALYSVFVACDQFGKRIFTLEDSEWLGEKQASAIERIYSEGRKLNTESLESIKKK